MTGNETESPLVQESSQESHSEDGLPPTQETSETEATQTDPRGVPWVDYVPEFTHKSPAGLSGKKKEFLQNLHGYLASKEILKLAFLDAKIHRSYYRMWVQDSNHIFRSAVRIKHSIDEQ